MLARNRRTLPKILSRSLFGVALCALPAACSLDVSGASFGTTAPGRPDASSSGSDASGVGGAGGAGTGAAAGMGGGGSGDGGGSGGDASPAAVCGDGVIAAGEGCDDHNDVLGDGCSACGVEPGYTCSGEPSLCEPIKPHLEEVQPNTAITDATDYYDGTLNTMDCADIPVPDLGSVVVQGTEITLGIQHSYLGDLVLKLVSPAGTIVTLMSRPGLNEPKDTYDDKNGDSSPLDANFPISFRDGAPNDAELMGSPKETKAVPCKDDMKCDYTPNPGAGPGVSLADFNGESPTGVWKVCGADGDETDKGTIKLVKLSLLAW